MYLMSCKRCIALHFHHQSLIKEAHCKRFYSACQWTTKPSWAVLDLDPGQLPWFPPHAKGYSRVVMPFTVDCGIITIIISYYSGKKKKKVQEKSLYMDL